MQISSGKRELMRALSIAIKTVPKRATMPMLENIVIETEDDGVSLMANNMESSVKVALDADIIEPGSVAVDGNKFFTIISKMPNDYIRVASGESFVTKITCKKAKFEIPGKDAELFPKMLEAEANASFTMKEADLKYIIETTAFASATPDSKVGAKNMEGEYFQAKGGNLTVTATDGHRVARRCTQIDGDIESSAVIPIGSIVNLGRSMSGDGDRDVTVGFANNAVVFDCEDMTYVVRVYGSAYFDIDKLFKVEPVSRLTADRKSLIECVERTGLLISGGDKKAVILDMDDNTAKLSCSTNVGNSYESLDVAQEGENIRIGMNHKYMIDMLSNIDTDEVTINFVSPKSPMMVMGEDGSYAYAVLPVNIS